VRRQGTWGRHGIVMGQAWGAGSGRLARVVTLALVASALTACSTSEPFRSLTSPLASTPASTQRPPNDLEPMARGGGGFKIGRPYELNGRTYVPAEDPNYRTEGIASWYGPDFHGKPTANGETFDMNGISAAHPTLPMPSYLRVTNLANGRSIIVRINDRGPYAKERVTDLSVGAAKALGFYDQGLARVRIEYVGRAPLGGSDDRMLLATLRHGNPAPAPSLARVAAAAPFALPSNNERAAGRGDRPLALGSPPATAAQRPWAPAAGAARPVVRAPRPSEPPAAYGLATGRGLY
jgi:rare lipoprotein A